jgi:Tol biopolymer transport system component
MTFTSPKIATLDFENMPSWSPDGKYLYYIKSPYADKFLHDTLEQYDLMRISFDENAIVGAIRRRYSR